MNSPHPGTSLDQNERSTGSEPSVRPVPSADEPAGKKHAIGVACGVIAGVAAIWGIALFSTVQLSVWETPRPMAAAAAFHDRIMAHPPGPKLDETLVSLGHDLFMKSCVNCHGPDGLGMPDLGKDLVHSEFVASRDDGALEAFIHKGRDAADPLNTTKTAMPPRGANPSLDSQQAGALVAYLRGLQDPRRIPDGEEEVLLASSDDMKLKMKLAGDPFRDKGGKGGLSRSATVPGAPCLPIQLALGACCNLGTGECTLATYCECGGQSTWMSDHTCTPNPCQTSADGACCHQDGSCTTTVAEFCPGTFHASATCATAACPMPTGACCSGYGTCTVTTRLECAVPGGYRGNGTICMPQPCPLVVRPRDGRAAMR